MYLYFLCTCVVLMTVGFLVQSLHPSQRERLCGANSDIIHTGLHG